MHWSGGDIITWSTCRSTYCFKLKNGHCKFFQQLITGAALTKNNKTPTPDAFLSQN